LSEVVESIVQGLSWGDKGGEYAGVHFVISALIPLRKTNKTNSFFMKSLILGACVSHLKKETGAFSFYLRYSSVMVPAPLLRRALIEREITPSFVSFDLLRGISSLGRTLSEWH
jgi:hypothetical protein